MCGIAAIYAYHYAASSLDREELRRVNEHMIPRGPDGDGEWVSTDGRIGLAHRRLAIIDLSQRGSQPMALGNGEIVISYNGEIYNYKELRIELERKGRKFVSESDTEVLLHLYAEKGDAMFEQLRGMYALALWDAKKRALLLARDPYGIKPLYYADDGWTVRAASQVKALLAGGKVSKDPEPAGIAGFYLFGSIPEPFTRYQEVRALPAGTFAWVDELGCHAPERYFSITQTFSDATKRPAVDIRQSPQDLIREALVSSVEHHLVSDVPVGAFLSAGVDSGALVGLMREVHRAEIQTITLEFPAFRGTHEDEAPLASEVARLFGTKHKTRCVEEDEFIADVPRLLAAMDQPSIDGVNTWFVSKAAKEGGLKVAISGVGGDELFGGYPSFEDIPRWVKYMCVPARIPFLGDVVRGLYGLFFDTPGSSLSPKAAGMVKYGGSYPGAYLLRRGLFMPWELRTLMGEEMAREGIRRLQPLKHIEAAMTPTPETPFAKVAALESSLYLRNQLLRDADWASMAHSVEIRTPLIDSTLLSSLAPYLVAGQADGKKFLANSPRTPLPRGITGRAKSGFSVPVGEWLQRLSDLDTWRRLPILARQNCHWARRFAYVLNEPGVV